MNLAPITKGALAIVLSQLKGFYIPKVRLEQYTTDSEVAASLLWTAFQLGDVQNKTIADLGAGTGVLGIGALLLGANHVFFVESEKSPLDVCQENLRTVTKTQKITGSVSFIHDNVEQFSKQADCIIQNPPFGTRTKGADTMFLNVAFKNARVIYSFHKSTTRKHIEKVSSAAGFQITHMFPFQLPLKASLPQHSKKIQRIDITVFRFEQAKGI